MIMPKNVAGSTFTKCILLRFLYPISNAFGMDLLLSYTTQACKFNHNYQGFSSSNNNSNYSSIYLFTQTRHDGLGSSTIHVIYAAAYCYYRGWKFGGINRLHDSHGVDNELFYNFLFGNYNSVLSEFHMKTGSELSHDSIIKRNIDSTLLNYNITNNDWIFYPNDLHFNSNGNDYINNATSQKMLYLSVNNVVSININQYPKDSFDELMNESFLNVLRRGAVCGVAKELQRNCFFKSNSCSTHIAAWSSNNNDNNKISHRHHHNHKMKHKQRKPKVSIVAAHIRRGDAINHHVGPSIGFYLCVLEALVTQYSPSSSSKSSSLSLQQPQAVTSLEIHVFTEGMKSSEVELLTNFNHQYQYKYRLATQYKPSINSSNNHDTNTTYNHIINANDEDNSHSNNDTKTNDILFLHNEAITTPDIPTSLNTTLAVQNTLAHLMTADILLTAHSGFSQLAALYNPNCVIYTRYTRGVIRARHEKSVLTRWIQLNESKSTSSNHGDSSISSDELQQMITVLRNRLPQCLHSSLSSSKSSL